MSNSNWYRFTVTGWDNCSPDLCGNGICKDLLGEDSICVCDIGYAGLRCDVGKLRYSLHLAYSQLFVVKFFSLCNAKTDHRKKYRASTTAVNILYYKKE